VTADGRGPAPATGARGARLGIDVGSVRVGVAVSDPDGLLAVPLTTLTRDPRGDRDVDEIATVVAERGVVEVVVGLPRHLSGAEGAAVAAARSYADRLRSRIAPVPVRLVDERLTTVTAERDLRAAGVKGRDRKAVVDQAAAAAILQSALDASRPRVTPEPPDPSLLPDLPPPPGRGERGRGGRAPRGSGRGRPRSGRLGR
jgi:putative Holliday junction resolvase